TLTTSTKLTQIKDALQQAAILGRRGHRCPSQVGSTVMSSTSLRHVVATLAAVFIVTPANADTIQLITSVDALGPSTDVVEGGQQGDRGRAELGSRVYPAATDQTGTAGVVHGRHAEGRQLGRAHRRGVRAGLFGGGLGDFRPDIFLGGV